VIPPNLGPPKHITFHDGAIEGKLRNQLVYQACISKQEMAQQKYMMGNRLVLKFKEEVIGEGQIILIAPVTYADITQYDAVLGGYERLEELGVHLKSRIPVEKTPEKTEFYKILFRWL